MLVEIRLAMYSSTSGGALRPSWTAFLRRIAIRVSSSGGWTSVSSPHSNRLRSRSSRVTSRLGARSLEMTICLLALCSVLKVWKNSSWVPSLFSRNWMSSTSSTSTSRYRRRNPSCLPSRIMLMKSLVNSSELTYRTLRPVVEALRVVADGVQQVGLAQPGVAVDEQRVVRLGGRLGDGDGGGVREPVARPDDERLERVLRVQPGRRAGRGGWSCWLPARCRWLARRLPPGWSWARRVRRASPGAPARSLPRRGPRVPARATGGAWCGPVPSAADPLIAAGSPGLGQGVVPAGPASAAGRPRQGGSASSGGGCGGALGPRPVRVALPASGSMHRQRRARCPAAARAAVTVGSGRR